jgi:purine nucleosidase
VLDGDFGVDDAMAALYLSSEPDIEILAVGSVHGNAEASVAARNAITVLDLAGLRAVPVAIGAARPMAQELDISSEVHGDDGLGGAAPPPRPDSRSPIGVPAAVQLVETLRAHPGECTILATGPLTNLALALLLDPAISGLVERVVVMGGTLDHPGNIGPYTEANIGHDPEAADMVLSADWPVTLVGLDVTMSTWLLAEDVLRIQSHHSDRGRFVASVLQHYLDFYLGRHRKIGCPLHDPTAARIAVDASLAGYTEVPVRVERTSHVTRGMLLVDRRAFSSVSPGQRPVSIATSIDRDRVVGRFMDGLLGDPFRS